MSGFSWDQPNNSRGIPSDVNGQPAPVPSFPGNPQQAAAAPQSVQVPSQPVSTMTPDEEEEYYNNMVLNDARLRLVQGSLYEKIMVHNLFEGYDADPIAIRNVEREIKKFARERMEIMLGMRQERVQHLAPPVQFNELEVSVLKSLASKATKGATETPEANKIATSFQPQKLNTISSPQKQVVNPIVSTPAPQQAAPVPQAPTPPPQDPTEPQKLLQEMTETEREAYFERNRQKYKPVKPATGGIPMPTASSEAMGYMAQAAQLARTMLPHEQSLLSIINQSNK